MFSLNTKIIIIDDMMTMRKVIRKALTEMGFTLVSESSDGDLAWPLIKTAAMKDEPFGLIISDWNMPNLKGIDLLKQVRADAQLSKIPFILLTAESESHQIQEAVKAGVDSYIIKPFTPDILKEKLQQVHARKAAS